MRRDSPAYILERTAALAVSARFDEFISWGEPFGDAGFDDHHAQHYSPDVPWFEYSARLVPHSHATARSWFIRQEHLGRKGLFTKPHTSAPPVVKQPSAMIRPGRYLRFAKAYVNFYCEFKAVRSTPKPTITALIYLEKALRDLNGGDNDPALISHLAFQRATVAIQRSPLGDGTKYDIGKALEALASMLQGGAGQGGQSPKRAQLPGFHLLSTSFSYTSPFASPPRYGKVKKFQPVAQGETTDLERLTSEEVVCVGLAYRRSCELTGSNSGQTFLASLLGLAFTTASTRASELLALRFDALFPDENDATRLRLRVPRPKLGIQQIVPVPRRLNSLATALFQNALAHSNDARQALAFYVAQSPDDFSNLHTLYIPDRLKPLFDPPYLTKDQVAFILGRALGSAGFSARRLSDVPRLRFVDRPGDIYGKCGAQALKLAQIRDVVETCRKAGAAARIPPDASLDQWVTKQVARLRIAKSRSPAVATAIGRLYESPKAKPSNLYVERDALRSLLLSSFKKTRFPHWPYTSKERIVRLDHALPVYCSWETNWHVERGHQIQKWWKPQILPVGALNQWISGSGGKPALLFETCDVRLSDGSYPSISVHKTRKFHHTEALLAGASPLFIDELAGRQSGWQSEHYDLRSPREILQQSIDTFDPDEQFEAIGPVADQGPSRTRIVERRVFLQESVAPKHVTEVGGCRSDWSLNPCHQFGDCMRCGSQVWRKGDQRRLPTIHQIRNEALRTIPVGRSKLRANPRLTSIAKHVRQLEETVARCDEILRIESDPPIAIGTVVTFAAAPSAMTDAELRSQLRLIADDGRRPDPH